MKQRVSDDAGIQSRWRFDGVSGRSGSISLKNSPESRVPGYPGIHQSAGVHRHDGSAKRRSGATVLRVQPLDDHVPKDHLLRGIDHFFDVGDLHKHMASFYSHTGRPSIDPE